MGSCCSGADFSQLAALDAGGWPQLWRMPRSWGGGAAPSTDVDPAPVIAELKIVAVPIWLEGVHALSSGGGAADALTLLRAALTLAVAARVTHNAHATCGPGIVSGTGHDFKIFVRLHAPAVEQAVAAALSRGPLECLAAPRLRGALSLEPSEMMLTEAGAREELEHIHHLGSLLAQDKLTKDLLVNVVPPSSSSAEPSMAIIQSCMVATFADVVWHDASFARPQLEEDATGASGSNNPLAVPPATTTTATTATTESPPSSTKRKFTTPDAVKRGDAAVEAGYFVFDGVAASASSGSDPAGISGMQRVLDAAIESLRRMNLRVPPACGAPGCTNQVNAYVRPCLHAPHCAKHVHLVLQAPCPRCGVRVLTHQFQPRMEIDQNWLE